MFYGLFIYCILIIPLYLQTFLFSLFLYIVKFKEVICTWKSINQEHISLILIIKLYALQELFPFKAGKTVPFHANLKENIIYFPHFLSELFPFKAGKTVLFHMQSSKKIPYTLYVPYCLFNILIL
jgi:hypothetical protein